MSVGEHDRVCRLVPIFCAGRDDLLGPLIERVETTFGLAVEVHPPGFDPELAFDASRGQYNSRLLLGQLLADAHADAARVLGVTTVDLFIPVLTFVFGEGQLDGRAAVVSAFRLGNERYGLRRNDALVVERLCKEAIHELGHTCGLVHCHRERCVMLSSTYVEEIDIKDDRFCPRCSTELRRRLVGGREPA